MVVVKYFLYFLIYSFIGWLMEVICKAIQFKRFVNRGFLIGPLCTIYGFGVLGIILLVGNPDQNIFVIFIKSIVICSILEYFTSYFMEKIFNTRWWDYSSKKFNINGRICLGTMLPVGILGTMVVYFLHPMIVRLVDLVPSNIQVILAIFLGVLFIIDNIISYVVMFKIKGEINKEKKDNTEYVREEVFNFLANNSILYRRIKNSYPNLVIRLKKIKKELEDKGESIKTSCEDFMKKH